MADACIDIARLYGDCIFGVAMPIAIAVSIWWVVSYIRRVWFLWNLDEDWANTAIAVAEITLKEKGGDFRVMGLWMMRVAGYASEVVDNMEDPLEEAVEEAIKRLKGMVQGIEDFGWYLYAIRLQGAGWTLVIYTDGRGTVHIIAWTMGDRT